MSVIGEQYTGLGLATIPTTTQDGVVDTPIAKVTLKRTDQTQDYEGYVSGTNGRKKLLSRVSGGEQWMADLEYQIRDASITQVMLRQYNQVSATAQFSRMYQGIVPTGDYTFADSKLTGLTAADVRVTIQPIDGNEQIQLKVVAIAPAADNEVQFDGTAGELIFDSAQAGKKFSYRLTEDYTDVTTNGYEGTATLINTVELTGGRLMAFKPNLEIYESPENDITGDLTFGNGDNSTLTLTPKAGSFRFAYLNI